MRKKHGLSTRKGTKLEIAKYFKGKVFITQKFLVLSLSSVWRFHLLRIVLDCSGSFLLVPGCSGLFWLVSSCSDWLRVVLGRLVFYKRRVAKPEVESEKFRQGRYPPTLIFAQSYYVVNTIRYSGRTLPEFFERNIICHSDLPKLF